MAKLPSINNFGWNDKLCSEVLGMGCSAELIDWIELTFCLGKVYKFGIRKRMSSHLRVGLEY